MDGERNTKRIVPYELQGATKRGSGLQLLTKPELASALSALGQDRVFPLLGKQLFALRTEQRRHHLLRGNHRYPPRNRDGMRVGSDGWISQGPL